MVQPPQPAGAQDGHPEPEPIPSPEPEPPQPIPPPDPMPAPPEPPHTVAAYAPAENTTDFIDADPHMASASAVEFPPVGAYPGEPGHPAVPDTPTEQLDPVQLQQATQFPPPADFEQTARLPPPGQFQQPAHFRLAGQFEQPGQFQQATEPQQTTQPQQYAQAEQTTQAQPTETWHQPPPTEPWHATHEKPGEWQTHPPDHLAWEHSPPAEIEPQTEPVWSSTQTPPWQVQLTVQAEPRKRRAGLWVSLALTVTLLLCGGGAVSAYFLISNADTGKGAPDPATAVNRFMTAVYTQQNASAADDLVCRDARNADQLAARVSQIKDYSSEYDGPTFRWSEPEVSGQTDEKATVSVQLTLATDDEKTAQQTLTFTAVHKTGWLVCDIAG
jgi:hypothetical protein